MIATFLVHDPDVMSRRKLWEPWLRLGDACRSWVEILLDEIFTAAAHAGNQDAIFGRLIGDIFDHALASGGWLDGKAHQAYRMSEIGKAFLGAGRLSSGEFWSANRAPVAIALKTYWPRWADVAIAWHGCAASFIRLLRSPAMESLRPGCLQWLVRADTNRWMSEDDARRALVRLLELVWSERLQDGKELRAEIRIVFERLLRELVTHQNADAVLLSTLVAREV